MKRRLQGAKSVILPSSTQVGLGDLGVVLKMYRAQNGKAPLESRLAEPLRAAYTS